MALARWVGRAIGLDVQRDFCEVAICEDGVTRSGGRVPSRHRRCCSIKGTAGSHPSRRR
jgi:hypothetical protein